MKVIVHLENQSQAIEYDNAKNTYQKGDLFCVYLETGIVHKYPIAKIFRVIEDYGNSQTKSK
jgi:hypothetical protein